MKIKEYDNSSYDLGSDNEDGYKSSNDCFMILIERPCKSLTLTCLFSFVTAVKQLNLTPFRHNDTEVYGVCHIWYQSESWTLGPIWAQINSAYFILRINDWILVCDNRKQVQQSRYFKLCRMQMFNWPCSCAGEKGTSSQDHNKYGHVRPMT